MSDTKFIHQKISSKNPPENPGWYDTDKGSLFFYKDVNMSEGVWSCRDDQISEEFPTFWYKVESVELPNEIELLRMQLTACGVAAKSNTDESILANRIKSDNPYYSASYQDVCNAVDREMNLKKQLEEKDKEIERLKANIIEWHDAIGKFIKHINDENKSNKA